MIVEHQSLEAYSPRGGEDSGLPENGLLSDAIHGHLRQVPMPEIAGLRLWMALKLAKGAESKGGWIGRATGLRATRLHKARGGRSRR